MEVKVGKPVDSRVLKRDWDKKTSCQRNKDLCEALSRNRRPCFLCSSNNYAPLATIYNYNYVQCSRCSLVYISNPPRESEIGHLYRSSYYDEMTNTLYANPAIRDYRVTNVALPKVVFVESRIGKKGKWLDLGCGTGEILSAARNSGWTVRGVETNQEAVLYARDELGIEVETGFITGSNAADYVADVDVISLFGVLEHQFQPVEFIMSLGSAARIGSYLVVEVPHYPSLSCYSQATFPDLVNRIMSPPLHLMIFTMQALQCLLDKGHYEIEHAWYFGQDVYELLTTLTLKLPEMKGSQLHDLLFEKIGGFQRVIDAAHLSDEVLVIAKKVSK